MNYSIEIRVKQRRKKKKAVETSKRWKKNGISNNEGSWMENV